jgi:energy-converting hydrogenase Eha subunit B
VRDLVGTLLVAKCPYRMGCLEPGDAEVLAAMEATQLCHEFGYARVMLVGDGSLSWMW